MLIFTMLTMLLLLLQIGCGKAEKSVLIIGGDSGYRKAATVEQFFPSKMTSRVMITIDLEQSRYLHDVLVTPVNNTHAFLLSQRSFFIDQQGHLTPGPTVDSRLSPGLTSIPGENNQMRPIYCYHCVQSTECEVMSADGEFKLHSRMIEQPWWLTLLTFGDELFAVGQLTIQRYDGTKWEIQPEKPAHMGGISVLKLNETTLLACGGHPNIDPERNQCYVYPVDKNEWTPAPETKKSLTYAKMVLIDQTVYAFGGHNSRTVQTLDISNGIGNGQWKVLDVQLEKEREDFGVWVIDSAWNVPDETTAAPTHPTTTTATLPSNKFSSRKSPDERTPTTQPNTPSSQLLTAGSIMFLILFLLVVYFVASVFYRYFVVGARGLEVLPLHEFWLQIYRS